MARNPLIKRVGIITKYGTVVTEDNKVYMLPKKAISNDGYPEVLIDARDVGGYSNISRQSVKPYVGMKCEFTGNELGYGFGFKVLKGI